MQIVSTDELLKMCGLQFNDDPFKETDPVKIWEHQQRMRNSTSETIDVEYEEVKEQIIKTLD